MSAGRTPARAVAAPDHRRRRGAGRDARRRRQHQGIDRCRSTTCCTSRRPINVWAVDARDGRTIWHYFWKTRGGIHIGNRGVGIYGDWLFFETPDNYLVSLDARTGKERWHTVIAPLRASVLLDAGAGDRPRPRHRRHRQRSRFARVPAVVRSARRQAALEVLHGADEARRSGRSTAGAASMPRATAARRPGCPAPTIRSTNLYYFGTGNPTPAFMTGPRGPGDHLFTNSLIARERGHREDGLGVSDLAARHPRLGLGADADPRTTASSTAVRGSSS